MYDKHECTKCFRYLSIPITNEIFFSSKIGMWKIRINDHLKTATEEFLLQVKCDNSLKYKWQYNTLYAELENIDYQCTQLKIEDLK